MLVVHMIKSGETLEWVIDQLVAGKKIPNSIQNLSSQQSGVRKTRTTASLSPGSKSGAHSSNRNKIETSGLTYQSHTPTGRSSMNLRKNLATNNYSRKSFTNY